MSDVDWLAAEGAYPPRRDVNNYGEPLSINGVPYPKGLWLDDSAVRYFLGGRCTLLTADLGIDDAMAQFGPDAGSVGYQVWLDGRQVYDSGLVTGGTPTLQSRVDLTGAQELRIVATDGGDGRRYDWADWGGAQLTCAT